MATVKLLGFSLIIFFLPLFIIYRITECKIVLFYAWMFLLFGLACFVMIRGNPETLKHKTFLILLSSTIKNEFTYYILKRLKYYGINLIILSDVELDYEDISIDRYINYNNINQIELLKKELDESNLNLDAIIALNDIVEYEKFEINYLFDKLVIRQHQIISKFITFLQKFNGRVVCITDYNGRMCHKYQTTEAIIQHAREASFDCLRRKHSYESIFVTIVETPLNIDCQPDMFEKSEMEILEALVAVVPKDRYLVTEKKYFNLDKVMIILDGFIPVTVMDQLINILNYIPRGLYSRTFISN